MRSGNPPRKKFLSLRFFVVTELVLLVGCSTGPESVKPEVTQLTPLPDQAPEVYRPLYKGGMPTDQVEPLRSALPYDRISLETTPCQMVCPTYEVTFHRSGKAEYRVIYDTPTHSKGDYVGQIHVMTYARLCHAMEFLGFDDLRSRYSRNATDTRFFIITATSASGTKQVVDHGGLAPVQFWLIQATLDSLRCKTYWDPVR